MQNRGHVINDNGDRQSCFELLRLVAMLFIVLYHYLLWFVQDNPSYSELRALWLPLHVGVICFVLISGFFRIKPSSRGFIKLVVMVLVYSLPAMIYGLKNMHGWHSALHSLMFISRSDYWFVRTYLGLYLMSPLINKFLDYSSMKAKWYMLIVTGVISIYLGNITRYNLYVDGKNLVNFLFLYQLGQMLSLYFEKWEGIKTWKLLSAYIMLNALLVIGYYCTIDSRVGELLWRLSFPYCSPLLIVNALLLFMIIGRLSFKSRVLNHLSAGVFAVYLIHCSYPFITGIQCFFIQRLFSYSSNYTMFVA